MHNVIATAISDALSTLRITAVDFSVEHPSEVAHGDYASNIALVVAKEVGCPPRAIAEQLLTELTDQIEYVDRIEVAGPGFLNFYLAREFFTQETARILTLGEAWGRNDTWAGKKVIVEYTDPNPFKEFHIGHLFTNTVGESIARLFMLNGADTKRVNYQGDVGMHVAHAVWGMQQLGLTAQSEFSAKDLGRAYAAGAIAYKESEAAAADIKIINKRIYDRSDSEIVALYDRGRTVSLAYFEMLYAQLDTQFDEYFFESEAGPRGKEAVLAHPEVFVESDGARIFKGEAYGLHTRVFVNSEGLPTYEAKEMALAKLKEERLGTYDHSVISTANEITEYFKVLRKAMSFVYPELAKKTEHIGHGMVRLTEGKMSSRTGHVIAATDFIADIQAAAAAKMASTGVTTDATVANAVAIAAIKYTTLKGNILQDTIFNKEKALSFEGDSGPYLQYTYARIYSLLANANQVNVTVSTRVVPGNTYPLEHLLYRFPAVIETALAERAPHKVTTYLTELAGAFNTFYAHEKIADPSDQYAPYKAALAAAVGQTLKNGLWVLGIKTPERM